MPNEPDINTLEIDDAATFEDKETAATEWLAQFVVEDAPPPVLPNEEPAKEPAEEPPPASEVDPKPGRKSRTERAAARKKRELDKQLAALKGRDPLELLRAAGHDPMALVDQLILGDKGKEEPDEVAVLKRKVAEMEERETSQKEKEQLSKQYKDAVDSITSEISPANEGDREPFPNLIAEAGDYGQASDIVIEVIRAEYKKSGGEVELTTKEAAERAEAYYKEKAKRYAAIHGKDEQPGKNKNLRSVGGSTTSTTFDKLSDDEKERLARHELQQELNKHK